MQKKMIAEATKRLEILQEMGLWEEAMRLWEEEGIACVSEEQIIFGQCGVNFTFNERPKLKEIKKEIEARYECIVYYGIYSETSVGGLLSLLFVSQYQHEWERDRSDLKSGIPCACVCALDAEFEEMGSIAIKMASGGLINISV